MAMLKKCSICGTRYDYYSSSCPNNCIKNRYIEYSKKRTDLKEQKFYNSKAWQELRINFIRSYCHIDIWDYYINKRITEGYILHHIIPIKDCWDKRLERDNLIYITDSNHKHIHDLLNKDYKKTVKILYELKLKAKKDFNF